MGMLFGSSSAALAEHASEQSAVAGLFAIRASVDRSRHRCGQHDRRGWSAACRSSILRS
ncbi:MAG: hypothetical protein MZV70_02915 [Desulfobacterales bacterium]|nr:hypothetical protein [Desulfobacterales bacterium]